MPADPYAVLEEWLTVRRGTAGHTLQGTTPQRYRADIEDWLHFIEHGTGIGAWHAIAPHAETWASSTTSPSGPRRRTSPHNRARRLSALSGYYRYAVAAGHLAKLPFDPRTLRGAAAGLPRTRQLTLLQTAELAAAAEDLRPDAQRAGRWGNGSPAQALRDRLLLHLLLDNLRPRQAIGLDLDDLVPDAGDAHVLPRKGAGRIRHRLSAETWNAITDYLPHRAPAAGPDSPLLTSTQRARIDTTATPRAVLLHCRARLGPDALLPEKLTCDQVAMSPSPHLDGADTADGPLHVRLVHAQHALLADGDADTWETTWENAEPDCWTWNLPPYDPQQRPEGRWEQLHSGRCAVCGRRDDALTEDADAGGWLRGLLCQWCHHEARHGAESPYWERYRQRPPAALLGLHVRTPWRRANTPRRRRPSA